MSDYEVGPAREQLDIPRTLDQDTIMWFMERYSHLAAEIGLDEILAQTDDEAVLPDTIAFRNLSKQKPTTEEGKAGALYILSRVIEIGREAFERGLP
jgi:hypothetical protein